MNVADHEAYLVISRGRGRVLFLCEFVDRYSRQTFMAFYFDDFVEDFASSLSLFSAYVGVFVEDFVEDFASSRGSHVSRFFFAFSLVHRRSSSLSVGLS